MSDYDEKTKLTSRLRVIAPPSPEKHRRPYLVVLAGANVGESFPLDKPAMVIGRSPDCDVCLRGDGISRRHARIVAREGAYLVEDLGSTNGTVVNGVRSARRVLAEGDKLTVGEQAVLKFTWQDGLEATAQKQLWELALRDPLTRLFNRRYFLDRLEAEFAYAVRHHTPLAVLLFDVDLFKSVNDTYGHLTGDMVLRRLSAEVTAVLRQEDVFARYGGEEFGVICREVSLGGGIAAAERLRALVESIGFEHAGQKFTVSISVGVSALPDPTTVQAVQLVERADTALYRAKREGRNRVIAAEMGMEDVPTQ